MKVIKKELLDNKLDKILDKAGNLDLELYRTLCKVGLADLKAENKSVILSQKDYDKPLKVKFPENNLFLSDKTLLEPIREHCEIISKLVQIEEQSDKFQTGINVNYN